ncbi:MAG TPA: M13 family metallopeptidase, partial [Thermoanaerobaculia bacterium]|nr:M13 family metallopeptidase [Thermoanaerobaculia bacterium]
EIGPPTAAPGEPGKARLTTLDVAGMDSGSPACTDFYQYANGGWLSSNPIPADRPRWATFDELYQRNQNDLRAILEKLAADRTAAEGSEERKLGDFYASCMDEAAIEANRLKPIEPELARIDAIKSVAGLRAEVSRLQSQGVNAIYAFGSEEDRKDSSQVIAAAVQAGLGLPDRDYYLKTDKTSVELRKKYVAHVAKMLELAGTPPKKAAADAKAILAVETRLAKASQNNIDLRDPDKTHHPMTLDAFSRSTPNLEWAAFFREQSVPAEVSINVWQPDFFRAADKLVKSVPIATWKTYLRWHLLDAAAPALPKKFVDENFAFNGTILAGTPRIQPRWKRCVNATDDAMGMALGRLYVKEHFPPEAKRRADELVKNLLDALTDDIRTLSWMSEPTKKAALEKVAAFGTKIGYPDKWRDYSTLEITRASYVTDVLAGRNFEWRRDLAKIGKPVDKTDWGMTPPEVNAYNNSAKNEIVFPAGILQPPFFYPEGDDAINYGAIGAVIGHEIIHGFDNSGRKFDAKGNQVDWWTAEDGKRFDEGANCIVRQFDGYAVDGDVHEKGALVQGESIADLGGLTIAYRAYKKSLEGKPEPAPIDGLTGDQRFFVANGRIWASNHRPEFARLMAQTNEHPLGRFRSIGTISNMPEFARVFGCNAGTAMVREPRCQIW